MQARVLYPSSSYEDNIFLAHATLFWATVGADDSAAAAHFDAAMKLYVASQDLRKRCGVPLSNWDAPCMHAMLLLVQGSGDYASWCACVLASCTGVRVPAACASFSPPRGSRVCAAG
jgi:hypothetical protein